MIIIILNEWKLFFEIGCLYIHYFIFVEFDNGCVLGSHQNENKSSIDLKHKIILRSNGIT